MANGKIRFGKQSGGVLSLTFPDGVTDTEVALPESGELVNKDYADLKVALANFTGTNVRLSGNGYQKLPSGLIIQWGFVVSSNTTDITFNYPIAFPNQMLAATTSQQNGNYTVSLSIGNKISAGLGTYFSSSGARTSIGISYIAIGY